MEERMEARKEISAEEIDRAAAEDCAEGRSRVPAPEMNPQVQLELLPGAGRKKAIGHVLVYNAIAIHGVAVMENSKKMAYVKMPRAPKGARTKHSDIVYPLNKAARDLLYSAVLQEYERLWTQAEGQRKATVLQIS